MEVEKDRYWLCLMSGRTELNGSKGNTYKVELKTGRDVSFISLRHFPVTHSEERKPELVE